MSGPYDHIYESMSDSCKKNITSTANNGGSTDYYKLPSSATDLQDLIEFKNMNFAQGNIFKAIYRLNDTHHSDTIRDLNKAAWFINREIQRLQGPK